MATGEGIRLADFPAGSEFSDDDYVYMTQDGATVKGTVAQLKTAVAISATQETFVAGDGVTPGTYLPGASSITLAGTYGSITDLDVYADAVPQLDCTLTGQTLGFTPTIPPGNPKIIVRGKQARSIGAPSDGTVTDQKLASGSKVYHRVNDSVTVHDPDFGMPAEGAGDGTAAFQAALTYAINYRKRLIIPARAYSLSGKITAAGNVSLWGEDMAHTVIQWIAGSSGFGIEITLGLAGGLSQSCTFEGFTLASGGAASGTGLKVIGGTATAADRITPRVIVDKLAVRGATNPTVDGFGTGLFFDNCTGVVVDKFNFWGKVDAVGEPTYDSAFGIRYDNTVGASPHPTEFSFTKCRMYYAQTLISANDFEGGFVGFSQLVGCNAGVRLLTPGPGYPHAIVNDSHINASDFCIVAGGMYEVNIHDNLLYKQLGTGAGVGVNVSSGTQFSNVHHNTLENLSPSAPMNGIIFDLASNNMADGNIFRRMDSVDGTAHGIGVWMTANSSNNRIGSHQLYNACTAATVLDQGTGNVWPG